MTSLDLKTAIRARVLEAGIDVVGFLRPGDAADQGDALSAFLAAGHHGDMAWLADTAGRRRHPLALWPEAKSIVMVGLNYGPQTDPLASLEKRGHGAISVYARGRDYHDVLKGRLKTIAGWLAAAAPCEVKVFVDTAPVMEKPLAQAAGLGWQGKHTNLVSRRFGSWLFLGAIFTTVEIEPDAPESDHCGACRACLDICPTRAFPAPYRLDATRCISYLTIEHKSHIPRRFRRAIGNRIYGCDDCLAVCPWNKFASEAREAKLRAGAATSDPPLIELLSLDDAGFRARFTGSPMKRTGRNRFMRNVLIAAGNSGDAALVPAVEPHLGDASPLVRAAAVWALGELLKADRARYAAFRQRHAASEHDAAVRGEWEMEP